jgi:hypothetical protein
LLLACGKFDGSNSSTWYLDTWASNYMCCMKESFVDTDQSYTCNITFEDLMRTSWLDRIKIFLKD